MGGVLSSFFVLFTFLLSSFSLGSIFCLPFCFFISGMVYVSSLLLVSTPLGRNNFLSLSRSECEQENFIVFITVVLRSQKNMTFILWFPSTSIARGNYTIMCDWCLLLKVNGVVLLLFKKKSSACSQFFSQSVIGSKLASILWYMLRTDRTILEVVRSG